jgi:hypothetical protein
MTIYVNLLDEGTSVRRPVEAVYVNADVYQIIEENMDLEDQHWAFPTGAKVKCKRVVPSDGRGTILIAYEEVPN